jgi:hypothetical protein
VAWCLVKYRDNFTFILIFAYLIEKVPVFYATRRFIIVCTRARHCTLSWTTWVQSTPSHSMNLIFYIFYHGWKPLLFCK